MKQVEKTSGIIKKNFQGKEIYEQNDCSGFDYKDFEKQLKGMEWEVRQMAKEIN